MSRRWFQFSIRSLLIAVAVCAVAFRFWPWHQHDVIEPSWFPLGGEVYQEQDRFAAQQQTLSFKSEPRWFLPSYKLVDKKEFDEYRKQEVARLKAWGAASIGFQAQLPWSDGKYSIPVPLPYPRSIDDLPTVDQGASLKLSIQATNAPHVLLFILLLNAHDRTVWREVEHRFTNTLPFLFAFAADGKAVQRHLTGWGKMGGANQLVELVDKGRDKTWKLSVDSRSIDALLTEPHARTLDVVAAFSERQHEGHFGENSGVEKLNDAPARQSTYQGPQILIRSNVVHLERIENAWKVKTSR